MIMADVEGTNDSTGLNMISYQAAAEVHKTFEEGFCSKLRASGSANLANAKDCSFSILANSEAAATSFVERIWYWPTDIACNACPPDDDLMANTNLAVIGYGSNHANEAQVSFRGVLEKEMTPQDSKILRHSIMSAYNDAFSSTGYSLTNFAERIWYWPTDIACNACPPDDDISATMPTAFTATVVPTGDNKSGIKASQLQFMHTAFEKAFCAKLQNSGAAIFANVHDCTFEFVSNPAAVAESSQM